MHHHTFGCGAAGLTRFDYWGKLCPCYPLFHWFRSAVNFCASLESVLKESRTENVAAPAYRKAVKGTIMDLCVACPCFYKTRVGRIETVSCTHSPTCNVC